MRSEDSHFSDQDLLLAADGELSAKKSAEVQAHLASCWTCRTRMNEIESAIGDFVHVREAAALQLPPADGPRALLKLRMAEMAAAPRADRRPSRSRGPGRLRRAGRARGKRASTDAGISSHQQCRRRRRGRPRGNQGRAGQAGGFARALGRNHQQDGRNGRHAHRRMRSGQSARRAGKAYRPQLQGFALADRASLEQALSAVRAA